MSPAILHSGFGFRTLTRRFVNVRFKSPFRHYSHYGVILYEFTFGQSNDLSERHKRLVALKFNEDIGDDQTPEKTPNVFLAYRYAQ